MTFSGNSVRSLYPFALEGAAQGARLGEKDTRNPAWQ
jgi:hypothetical protein